VRRRRRDQYQAYVDINHLARETIIGIGYDDGAMGFDGRSCGILVSLDSRAPTSPTVSTSRSNTAPATVTRTC